MEEKGRGGGREGEKRRRWRRKGEEEEEKGRRGGDGGERERRRKRRGEEEEEGIEASRELLAKFLPHVSPNCHKTNLSTDPGSATEYSTSCVLALPTTILSISSRLVSVRLVR